MIFPRSGYCSRLAMGAVLVVSVFLGSAVQQVSAAPAYLWSYDDNASYFQEPATFPTQIYKSQVGNTLTGGQGSVSYDDPQFVLKGGSHTGPDGLGTSSSVQIDPSAVPNVALYATETDKASWNDAFLFTLTGRYKLSDPEHSTVFLWFRMDGQATGQADDLVDVENLVAFSARLGTGPATANSQTFGGKGPYYYNYDTSVRGDPLASAPLSSSVLNPWSQATQTPLSVSIETQAYVSMRWDQNHDPRPTGGYAHTFFYDTLQILGFEAKDGDGTPLPADAFSIESASGYSYPILLADPTAPEPSSLVLAGLGAVSLGFAVLRKKRRRA
jgi:hypothetical protein